MGGTFKIVHIRTPAVQHKKLTKNLFSFTYQWEYTGKKI